jgi:hypothetical protein
MEYEVTITIKHHDDTGRQMRKETDLIVEKVLPLMHSKRVQNSISQVYDVKTHQFKKGMDVEKAKANSTHLVFTIN